MRDDVAFDSVDVAILRILQSDGRIANKDLAAAVGVAPSTCLDRVARLRRAGVITGYLAEVDAASMGRTVDALLAVQVQPHSRGVVDPFVAHVLALPETRAVHHVTGVDDFIVHVSCGSTRDLQRLVLDEFTTRPEVGRVQTHLIFGSWRGGPLLPYPS
ncbi:Lrp/AsnC family transcriptional regulator [Actinocrispum wychmicini]|uniref:DNA-binding Lrp family transcriptional regulator n=1 Tax=Actinocrispum wychmicini TaxID=1213861 RepID=A0A4R2JU02_9PSEU|nr:Lrp/AsnC family transcriptional regulator [Actinocrispum wychmicini]TCO60479.1 DNA-binding Lrp family transcriptional regulator [Actinocrispum wychmicini]